MAITFQQGKIVVPSIAPSEQLEGKFNLPSAYDQPGQRFNLPSAYDEGSSRRPRRRK